VTKTTRKPCPTALTQNQSSRSLQTTKRRRSSPSRRVHYDTTKAQPVPQHSVTQGSTRFLASHTFTLFRLLFTRTHILQMLGASLRTQHTIRRISLASSKVSVWFGRVFGRYLLDDWKAHDQAIGPRTSRRFFLSSNSIPPADLVLYFLFPSDHLIL
jgi:hypothetical protein